MSGAFVPPGECPNCGDDVPAGARSCPGCGADERTGWSSDTYLDGIDLPAEEPERPAERPVVRAIQAWVLIAVFVALTLVFSGIVGWIR